jgi:hypothetical protein
MPSKNTGQHDKQSIVASLYRYRPIYQYKSEIRQYEYTAQLKQRSQRATSRNDFRPCLAIYSKWHIFPSCCKISVSPHNIAKPDFCQYRTRFNHAIRCNDPSPYDAIQSRDTMAIFISQRSDTMIRDAIPPVNPADHNQYHQRHSQRAITLDRTQHSAQHGPQGLQGISFYMERPTAWGDTPHSPNSRDSKIQILLFI